MTQPKLFVDYTPDTWKSIHVEHIKASFLQIAEYVHEVILEINSQKFLVRVQTWLKRLEHFEVLAVKWCIELCVKTIRMLKRIVTSLYFEY
jgi:hypothetical protein